MRARAACSSRPQRWRRRSSGTSIASKAESRLPCRSPSSRATRSASRLVRGAVVADADLLDGRRCAAVVDGRDRDGPGRRTSAARRHRQGPSGPRRRDAPTTSKSACGASQSSCSPRPTDDARCQRSSASAPASARACASSSRSRLCSDAAYSALTPRYDTRIPRDTCASVRCPRRTRAACERDRVATTFVVIDADDHISEHGASPCRAVSRSAASAETRRRGCEDRAPLHPALRPETRAVTQLR